MLPKKGFLMSDSAKYIHCEKENDYVEVYLPKFTQRKNIDIIPYLQNLGVKDLFSKDHARLTNMCPVPIFVSKIIHQAVIFVGETGTEIDTTAVMEFMKSCAPARSNPKIFFANHSFVYYIKHKPTKLVLLEGVYHGN
jgi:serine protease inhibitor